LNLGEGTRLMNPLGVDGIEYVEYVTSEPQSFGAALERLGFAAVARHRSREIVLYRAGAMNVIVNSDPSVTGSADEGVQAPRLKAFALRVRDAAAAYSHCIEKGAWPITDNYAGNATPRAGAMELNIPGIMGVGESVIYFVDRYEEFSIYDVDFKRLPSVTGTPPAIAGMHFFGIVQAIEEARTKEWVDFYQELFSFKMLPQGQYFGVLPKGTLLESPCRKFYLQLVEPPEQAAVLAWQEKLTRVGFGAPDVKALVAQLGARGVTFIESNSVHTSDKGAVTYLGGTSFEFVKSHLGGAGQ
jgi:4-hydroxyphenylpyruvate dioxygenase